MKPIWPNVERWNLLYSVETAKLRNRETAETCETCETAKTCETCETCETAETCETYETSIINLSIVSL